LTRLAAIVFSFVKIVDNPLAPLLTTLGTVLDSILLGFSLKKQINDQALVGRQVLSAHGLHTVGTTVRATQMPLGRRGKYMKGDH
jgi:hypothetical protein